METSGRRLFLSLIDIHPQCILVGQTETGEGSHGAEPADEVRAGAGEFG